MKDRKKETFGQNGVYSAILLKIVVKNNVKNRRFYKISGMEMDLDMLKISFNATMKDGCISPGLITSSPGTTPSTSPKKDQDCSSEGERTICTRVHSVCKIASILVGKHVPLSKDLEKDIRGITKRYEKFVKCHLKFLKLLKRKDPRYNEELEVYKKTTLETGAYIHRLRTAEYFKIRETEIADMLIKFDGYSPDDCE
jgi:hypothetical protein